MEIVEKQDVDILLVNPSLDVEQDSKKRLAMRIDKKIPNQESPPLGMGYLIAVANQHGLKAKFIDMGVSHFTVEDLLEHIGEVNPKLVGFTAYTVQIKSAAFIAKEIKKRFPALWVCAGGVHATVTPKETLEEFEGFDFAICGEAELLLPKLLDSIGRGTPLSDVAGVVTRDKKEFSRQAIECLDDCLCSWISHDRFWKSTKILLVWKLRVTNCKRFLQPGNRLIDITGQAKQYCDL